MREYIRRAVDALMGARHATMDTIEPGSIRIAPRRPIDQRDTTEITRVLDLAARIGAILLDAGTGAIDTEAQIRFITRIYGVADTETNVTFNTIVVTARRGPTLPAVTTMRQVHYRSIDFTRLAQIDRLIRHIRDVAITPGTAHRMLDQIDSAPHPYPHWVATIAWGVMASGVSVLIGGGVFVALITLATTIVVVAGNRRLNRIGTPPFFQQLVGGFIAVVPAAVIYEYQDVLGISIRPSLVIAAGIVVLLSGLSLVGSVQDAITGAPITGVGRFFELLLMTGGIVAGVSFAIQVLRAFGIYLPTITAVTEFSAVHVTIRVAAGAVAAAAFALASYAERRALPVALLGGAIGSGVTAGLAFLPIGDALILGLAAAVVGLFGGLLARRALTPPMVVAMAGITPLLPGLAIYRGLYGLMNDQLIEGIAAAINAITIGVALAAGVTLGEVIARGIRRPALLAGRRNARRAGRGR